MVYKGESMANTCILIVFKVIMKKIKGNTKGGNY